MAKLRPTERELEILKVLWQRGGATVREVCHAMNAAGNNLAYTTVLSLMQVMENKGLLTHRQEGKAYIYLPNVKRNQTFRELAASFLERVFDGALDEYVVHALESRKVSETELEKIHQAIIDAHRRASRRKRKNK